MKRSTTKKGKPDTKAAEARTRGTDYKLITGTVLQNFTLLSDAGPAQDGDVELRRKSIGGAVDFMRRSIESGGVHHDVMIDVPYERPPPERVFEVIAIDLATASLDRPSVLKGHQFCHTLNLKGAANANWYRRALTNYFQIGSRSSLLAYRFASNLSSIAANLRWYLIRHNRKTAGPAAVSPFVNAEPQEWFEPFPASYPTNIEPDQLNEEVYNRFREFAATVFKELDRSVGSEAARSYAVAWIYVGPRTGPLHAGGEPDWAQSLFIVFRPIEREGVDWEHGPLFLDAWLRVVDRIASYLGMWGATQGSWRQAMNRAEQQKTFGVGVHECKNLMTNAFAKASQLQSATSRSLLALPSDITQPLNEMTREVGFVAAYLEGLNALQKGKACFGVTTDRAVEIVLAAVQFSLRTLATCRPEWRVKGPSLESVYRKLKKCYGVVTDEAFIENTAIGVLLCMVGEPCRNIRYFYSDKTVPNRSIEVWAKAVDGEVLIYQDTLEPDPPTVSELPSPSCEQLNHLLPHELGEIDPKVVFVQVRRLSPERYLLRGKTTIRVKGRPTLV